MRFHGTLGCFDQPCSARGLSDLPENWQNSLYPYGSPNTNYQDGVSGSSTVVAGTIAFMQNLAAKGYPKLPFAGALDQTPGVIPSEIPSVYFPPRSVAVQNPAPPPIFIATVPAPPAPPPPVYAPPSTPPTYAAPPQRGGGQRQSLQGIPDSERSAFPMPVRGPSVSGNIFWYTGQPTLNRGVPVWSNDANEFLRHAMVESDWDDVEIWLAWAIANGFDQDKLYLIDFGRYKYTQDQTSQRIYYPFSREDYETFFARFLKYASAVPVDSDCMKAKLANYRKAIASNPRNQFSLRLSECPLTTGWGLGLLKAVAVIAIPYAIATAATALAAAASTGTAAGAAGAAGASAAAGSGATAASAATAGSIAASAASVAVPVIETVVVTASAIPVIGAASVAATAISAGAIVALATPPPISAPSIPNVPEAPVETVTVTASTIAPAPVLPAVTLATSLPILETALPLPEIAEPQIPEIEDSVYDTVKTQLKELAGSLGAEKLKELLAEKLRDKLQREPTIDEEIAFEEYVDALPPPTGRIANTSQSKVFLVVLGIVVTLIVLSRRRKKVK